MTQGPQNHVFRTQSLCITRRLGLVSGWRKEVAWEWEPVLLLVTLSASAFPYMLLYNEPPETQRGAATAQGHTAP